MQAQSHSPRHATTTTGRLRRRAVEACSFCRKRKIKCNAEKPRCANCKNHGKECIFEPLKEPSHGANRESSASARGSIVRNSRAKTASSIRAERHFYQSQEIGSNIQGNVSNGDTEQDCTNNRSGSTAVESRSDYVTPSQVAEPAPQARSGISRIVVSPNGIPSYHGQTSTLFEENLQDRGPVADALPRMSDEWIEKGLVAEAAKQRLNEGQLEEFNYGSGLLDFDGVDPELGMHLLSLHWNRQHHSYNITYRPAFMRDMACSGPYFSKLLLNAIYFCASKFSPRHDIRKDPGDVRTAGWEFRERVRKLLGSALDHSDITTIQALLVMANTLFALGDERSAAWLYSGLAFRMIIDLGMHVDAPDLRSTRKFSDEDLEIRRRVFWAAFLVDKIQSLYQGRPVTLKESDALVPIKFLDTYEEFEHWKPFAYNAQSSNYPGSPAYSVSTFTSLCRLSVVMSDILSCMYTERASNQGPAELSKMLDSLDSKLAAWRDGLPAHLVFDPNWSTRSPPPHVLSLHAMYNVLIILLHRPFVADGHLYNTTRSISINSLITCASAADSIVAILRTYDRTFSVRRAPYLISYACYVAATIHTRIAAKRSIESEAHSNLETCLAMFRENQETNWAVGRAYAIIQNLIKKLGVIQHSDTELNHDHIGPSTEPNVRAGASCSLQDIDTAASTITGPGEAHNDTPALGWSDIDGIIQTFARGQDAIHAGTEEASLRNNAVQSRPTGTTRTHPGPETFEVPNFRHANEDGNSVYNGDFQDGSAASIDDLLFGFYGPALDNYPFIDFSK